MVALGNFYFYWRVNRSTARVTTALLIVHFFSYDCTLLQEPVAHTWTKQVQIKKKRFCNVCRKKICNNGLICEG
jgi:hypothetical protein